MSVGNDLLFLQGDISNGNVEAHDLLHLELDGGLDLINLLLHILAGGKEGGELSSLGQTRTKKTGDLLDHVVGGKEEIILLGEFLYKLLVLVELLKIINTKDYSKNTTDILRDNNSGLRSPRYKKLTSCDQHRYDQPAHNGQRFQACMP